MSNPYGPPLETVEDWNAALGCCCEMPVPSGPVLDGKSISADLGHCGEYPSLPVSGGPWDYPDCATYQTRFRIVISTSHENRTQIEAGGYTYADEKTYSRGVGGECSSTFVVTDSASDAGEFDPGNFGVTFNPAIKNQGASGGGYFYEWTRTGTFEGGQTWSEGWRLDYLNPSDLASLTTDATALLNAAEADENLASSYLSRGNETVAKYEVLDWTTCSPPKERQIKLTRSRYRWRVPVTHLGTYFKITWDVLYEPVGWDDTGIPIEDRPIRYSRKNLTVEWTGPGSGAQSDASWLAGDWMELAAPEEPGIRKIINVRFTQFQDAP